MDGVPIGRKVDLKAHGGYGKLADAVDHLFRGLLAGTHLRTHAPLGLCHSGVGRNLNEFALGFVFVVSCRQLKGTLIRPLL